MVSNICFSCCNIRLCEIFNTIQEEDGYFGKINILLFGDLLQLQPVGEASFADIPKEKQLELFGSLSIENLWIKLFSYDELTQNVTQQEDPAYANALSEIPLGILSESSEQLLNSKVIKFDAVSMSKCLDELANYVMNQPNHCICLFPTRAQCAALNAAVLSKLNDTKITLKAVDKITAKDQNAAKRKLQRLSDENKSSFTGGLEGEIDIKVGGKVMLQRNI
uniref:Uncharacterized protein LOC114346647 n=1 Tax=Diabrotica virgifera virgifera TaxID=50390 RepID=A0A6P7H648_DIAVI